jgi:ferredoxin--NADP+ reductase
MYEILKKIELNPTVTLMEIKAPEVAKHAKAGQFIILRVDEAGERIPLTIADANLDNGSVTIIFQVVGLTTKKLNLLKKGDYLLDFVGPLGNPSNIAGLKRVCIVGGGVGSAICLPLAKALFNQGTKVDVILGFRNKDLIILEDEFKKYSQSLIILTDDGSNGNKGLVTDALKELLSKNSYDKIFTVGPLIMMKFVTKLAKEYNQNVIVSMNPVMIDGTGMCGGCRISVNGKQKFACVDGPEFPGDSIDFDEAIARSKMYKELEREKDCNLFKI